MPYPIPINLVSSFAAGFTDGLKAIRSQSAFSRRRVPIVPHNQKKVASPQMQSTPRERLLQFSHFLQRLLSERLEQEVGPLKGRSELLVAIMRLIGLAATCSAAHPVHRAAAWKSSAIRSVPENSH